MKHIPHTHTHTILFSPAFIHRLKWNFSDFEPYSLQQLMRKEILILFLTTLIIATWDKVFSQVAFSQRILSLKYS